MWSRVEAENWIFQQIEFIETIIVEYLRNLIGIIFTPKKSIARLHIEEKVSPFIFYLINVVIATLIQDMSDKNVLLNVLLKSVVLTTNPTWDDNLWSIVGLLLGSFLIVFLIRGITFYKTRSKLSYQVITKSVLYGSFTFIPIVCLKSVIASIAMYNILPIINVAISQSYKSFIAVLIAIMLIAALYLWWGVIVKLWINCSLQNDASPNIISWKLLSFIFCVYYAISVLAVNLPNLSSIQTAFNLFSIKKVIDESLAKTPPEYGIAGMATMFISTANKLTPYRRYCEKIRSVVYLSQNIQGFDFDSSLSKLKKFEFEEIESSFNSSIAKIESIPHSEEEYIQIAVIKALLAGAKIDKKDEKYVKGEYITTFQYFQLPIFPKYKYEYLRLIP